MKRVIYSNPWIPAEWIEAHGLRPLRLIPRKAGRRAPLRIAAGMCPFMAAFINEACSSRSVSAIVLTTTCDQMRRAADALSAGAANCPPLFLMNIPATWQTAAARGMYVSELKRLSRFLVQVGGRRWSHASLRRAMARNGSRTTPLAGGTAAGGEPGRIAIAVVGGPLAHWDKGVLDAIGRSGGHVVLDATENGGRTAHQLFQRDMTRTDPLAALVKAYFENMPDAFRRPNTQLHDWLRQQITERGVRGIIVLRYLWCDLWHAETYRLRHLLDIPTLQVDLNGEPPPATVRTRIQAFLEALRQEPGEAVRRRPVPHAHVRHRRDRQGASA